MCAAVVKKKKKASASGSSAGEADVALEKQLAAPTIKTSPTAASAVKTKPSPTAASLKDTSPTAAASPAPRRGEVEQKAKEKAEASAKAGRAAPAAAPAAAAVRPAAEPVKPAPAATAAPASKPPTAPKKDPEPEPDYENEGFDSYSDEDFEEPEPEPTRSTSSSPLDALTFGKKPKSGPLAMKPSGFSPQASSPAPAPAPSPAAGSALRRPAGHVPHKEAARDFTVARVEPKPRNVSGIMHPRARRVEFLRPRVELVEEVVDIFYQAPLPPYDLYLNLLRAGVSRQTGAQTNDDAVSEECQTEHITQKAASMQFPDDIGVGSSTRGSSKDDTGGASTEHRSKASEALRLLEFLRRTSQAVESLLDENVASVESVAAARALAAAADLPAAPASRAVFGGDNIIFVPGTLPYLVGRTVVDVCFSNSRPNDVLVAYTPVSGASSGLKRAGGVSTSGLGITEAAQLSVATEMAMALAGAGEGPESADTSAAAVKMLSAGGLLCLWDINDTSAPRMVLSCAGTPSSCAFSPGRSHVAVAGLQEGSVCIWDLRESVSQHVSVLSSALNVATGIRPPTYATDPISTGVGHHCSAVCKVIPLDAAAASSSSSSSAATSGIGASVALGASGASSKTSFQFASLDDRGLVNFWVAVEIVGAEWVSEVDFGLGIGARLKLIRTASCHVYQEQSVVDAAVASAARATLLDPGNFGATIRGVHFCPADLNKFVVACSNGSLQQRSRFGEELSPKSFAAPDSLGSALAAFIGGDDYGDSSLGAVSATCVEYCPSSAELFLAGFSDGKLGLYSSSSAEAVTYWDLGPNGVAWVHWSTTTPGLFYVVDLSPCVHVFNLLVSDKGPIASQFLDATMKNITGVACSDSARRGLKTLLAFSSQSSAAVCVYSVASQLTRAALTSKTAQAVFDELL